MVSTNNNATKARGHFYQAIINCLRMCVVYIQPMRQVQYSLLETGLYCQHWRSPGAHMTRLFNYNESIVPKRSSYLTLCANNSAYAIYVGRPTREAVCRMHQELIVRVQKQR